MEVWAAWQTERQGCYDHRQAGELREQRTRQTIAVVVPLALLRAPPMYLQYGLSDQQCGPSGQTNRAIASFR